MIQGASGELFPKLEHSDHFPILSKIVKTVKDETTLIELGCGAAEFARVFPGMFYYIGADLPHIIDDVTKKVNPNVGCVSFDVFEDDISFIGDFDVVLMSAFLDVMERAGWVLNKVLRSASKYVIIHRQNYDFSEDGKSSEKLVDTLYGGQSYQSELWAGDFMDILTENNFEIVQEYELYHRPEENKKNMSVLLRKK